MLKSLKKQLPQHAFSAIWSVQTVTIEDERLVALEQLITQRFDALHRELAEMAQQITAASLRRRRTPGEMHFTVFGSHGKKR